MTVMRSHEIIEYIVTNVCEIKGLIWQDVFNAKPHMKLHYEAKFAITHLIYMYMSIDVAMEIMNYKKHMIYYASTQYYEKRNEYRELEFLINKKIGVYAL